MMTFGDSWNKICCHFHLNLTQNNCKNLFDFQLQSGSSDQYEQPQTRLNFGQRAFSYAAPAAWNSLPPMLQQMSNTDFFKRHLKTFLYPQAYLN